MSETSGYGVQFVCDFCTKKGPIRDTREDALVVSGFDEFQIENGGHTNKVRHLCPGCIEVVKTKYVREFGVGVGQPYR